MLPAKKQKPIATWSIYKNLYNKVSSLLVEPDLYYKFYENNDNISSTNIRDTNVIGHFIYYNRAYRARRWSSNMIAITIRLFLGQKYNTRVYY